MRWSSGKNNDIPIFTKNDWPLLEKMLKSILFCKNFQEIKN